jgi:protein involved in polysaccharide export with SLBB domain
LELLARAGGATEQAEGTVLIVRSAPSLHGAGESVDVYNLAEVANGSDEKANPYLQPADIAYVSEAKAIYISGSVKEPKGIYIKEPITLRQAIKLAGGLSPNAQIESIQIYRQTPNSISKTVIKINPKQINKHRSKDVILQPNDIIDVVDKRRVCCIKIWPSITPTTGASLPLRILN